MTTTSSSVYFYQQRGYVRHIKRFKKQADQLPQSLRNYLNPKANLFRRNPNDGEGTLTSRLAEMALFGDESLDFAPGTASTKGRQRSLLSGSSAAGNPYNYTDTRLNAMKQLTEGLVHELQEYLNRFVDAHMRPILGGPIIYDLHADWSDLTDNCTYDDFPQWRTKHGRDLLTKPAHGKKHIVDDDATSTSSSTGVDSRSNSGLGMTATSRQSVSNTSKKSAEKLHRQAYVPPRLDPISEEKNLKRNSIISNNDADTTHSITPPIIRSEHRNSIIHFGGVTEPPLHQRRNSQFGRKMSILKSNSIPNFNQNLIQTVSQQSHNTTTLEVSRVTTNSSSLSGWAVTFNLSNSLYEEKGWTIVSERVDEQPIDFERRALRCLNKSINSM
jgi:hypothetical protein